jgi:hypothetical protein
MRGVSQFSLVRSKVNLTVFDGGVAALADEAQGELLRVSVAQRKNEPHPSRGAPEDADRRSHNRDCRIRARGVGCGDFLSRKRRQFPVHPAPKGRREGCGQEPSFRIARGTKKGQAKLVSRRTDIVTRDGMECCDVENREAVFAIQLSASAIRFGLRPDDLRPSYGSYCHTDAKFLPRIPRIRLRAMGSLWSIRRLDRLSRRWRNSKR